MSVAGPSVAIFGNSWGLLEMPRRPSRETWSFEQCMEKLKANGFDGCQSGAGDAKVIRSFGLRFAAAGRISTPGEADDALRQAADAGAECMTVHLGWGTEDDAGVDALIDALLAASSKHGVPAFAEVHRATVFQDIWRMGQAIARRPEIRFNGDFSHVYCGQEMGYRGFEATREFLRPVIDRTRFIHGRVSDGQVMQCDIDDPIKSVHVDNFRWLWREAMAGWLRQGAPGGTFWFTPELGPASSGYSITYPNANGERVELGDRWSQTLRLARIGRELWAEVGGK
jgi:sugar phosphate isomerase/epimerase